MAYVTDTGLQRKTLQELRLELENAFKQVFGVSFETSVDSPNGLLISQLALALSNQWELAQEVFVSRDPAQATGVALDWAAALSGGLTRREATACTVEAVLFTEESSVTIPAGSSALRARGNLEFTLDSAVTIARSACEAIYISDDGSEKGTDYVFHFSFGDVTLNNTGSQTNLAALAALITSAGGTAEVVNGMLKVTDANASSVGITGSMPSDWIVYATMTGNFTASVTGLQTCEIGELDAITSPVDGWDAVYNFKAGIAGADRETDAELRVRRLSSVKNIQARGTDKAIAAHLMEEVDGVSTAKVVSNRYMTTDSNGRPPKSFEALVTGGTDADVAQCIYENQPAGIQSYGDVTVMITDENGDEQPVCFSRPVAKYLWVRVTYIRYSEETLSGNDTIKTALVDWAEKEYSVGVDVIPSRILQGLYTGTTGIGSASVEVAITDNPEDTPSWGSSVIPIPYTQHAALEADRIVLVEN